jgi:hypothetical protein
MLQEDISSMLSDLQNQGGIDASWTDVMNILEHSN